MRHFKWKRFWTSRNDADLERNSISFSKRKSPSSLSAFYDSAVRTNSYNEIATVVLERQSHGKNATTGLRSFVHIDRLLEPAQESVDAFLQERTGFESPEMMKLAVDFFDNSCMASTLCGAILQSIDKTKSQCGRMDATLAEMPRSGEDLGFMQQQVMVQGLSEMIGAENPFANGEACRMFANVRDRYILLSSEVEEKRRVVGRKVKVLRRWRGGCIGIVVALVAGATLVAVVVATHVVVSVAVTPATMVAAAIARGRLRQNRGGVTDGGSEAMRQGSEDGMTLVENGASHVDMAGALVEMVDISNDRADQTDAECGWTQVDVVEVGGKVADSPQMGGCLVRQIGSRRGRGAHSEFWCWGMALLAGQSAKLDALARGSFLVNRMLDTLRCLVTGLQDDVDRYKRLVEFGWMHREEAACVQQVGKQLLRSHIHLVHQLAKLEEQIVVCFLLINKARGSVLQEFSPKT